MSWAALIVILVLAIAALTIASRYYYWGTRGKTDVAVSSVASIASIWLGYCTLLSINWPTAIIVIILRRNQNIISAALEPSWKTIFPATVVAILASALVYKLANAQILSNSLPSNASSFEFEELGKIPGIFGLTLAHIRLRATGVPDRILYKPGETPYTLPPLNDQLEYAHVVADILVQLEPNLDKESFRYIEQKSFFVLSENNPFAKGLEKKWVIHLCEHNSSVDDILSLFDQTINRIGLQPDSLVLYLCVHSEALIDKICFTPAGLGVRYISDANLIGLTLKFERYVASLIHRYEVQLVPGTAFSLEDCFVAPKYLEINSGIESTEATSQQAPQDLLNTLSDWAKQPNVDHVSVVGEYGQGKSTAILAFCAQWARRWHDGVRNERIPLLIELRGKSPARQPPERFLAEWGDRFLLSGEALFNLIKTGRVILIFEGFDEIQDAGLRFQRFEQFKALWSFSYPGVKIVFTGRPNFFLDTNEREKLLRSSPAARAAGLDNSRILSLEFLDLVGITTALRKFSKQTSDQILEQCRSSHSFFDIAKRPSMLPVIGSQWAQINTQLANNQGITPASIISFFIEFLYARKEVDKERFGTFQLLHRSVRHYFTQQVAWRMAVERFRNTIDNNNFIAAIEQGWKHIDTEFREDENADPLIASSIRSLKELFKGQSDGKLIGAIATDVRTNGILALDPAGGKDNLYFPHKQYYEYILGEIFTKHATRAGIPGWASRIPSGEVKEVLLIEPAAAFFASGLLEKDWYADISKSSLVSQVLGSTSDFILAFADFIGFEATFWISFIQKTAARAKLSERLRVTRVIYRHCPFRLRRLGFESRLSRGHLTADIKIRTFILGGVVTGSLISGFTLVVGFHTAFLQHKLDEVTLVGLILGGFLNVALSTYLVTRNNSELTAFLFLTEIYMKGCVSQILSVKGKKANAAILLLTSTAIPKEAVPLSKALLEKSLNELAISEKHVDIFV